MNSFATERALTASQLAVFAAALEEQRRFRVEQLLERSQRRDILDVVDREIDDTIARGARAALAEIESARSRMSDGSYGHCVDCGDRLPIERLEILPHVPRCMACHRATGS